MKYRVIVMKKRQRLRRFEVPGYSDEKEAEELKCLTKIEKKMPEASVAWCMMELKLKSFFSILETDKDPIRLRVYPDKLNGRETDKRN